MDFYLIDCMTTTGMSCQKITKLTVQDVDKPRINISNPANRVRLVYRQSLISDLPAPITHRKNQRRRYRFLRLAQGDW